MHRLLLILFVLLFTGCTSEQGVDNTSSVRYADSLSDSIRALNHQKEELSQDLDNVLEHQQSADSALAKASTVYYIVATQYDLIDVGIYVPHESGNGYSLNVDAYKIDKYFTPINKKVLMLPVRGAVINKISPPRDDGSYELADDGIHIIDPAEFWKAYNYCIISVEPLQEDNGY